MTKQRIDSQLWYTAREAAEMLEVVEDTVKQYCRDGVFKASGVKQIGPKRQWHVVGSAIIARRKELGLDVKR